MLIRDFGDILRNRQADLLGAHYSRKTSRGGSVSNHINRSKFDSVHRSFTPFRDIT